MCVGHETLARSLASAPCGQHTQPSLSNENTHQKLFRRNVLTVAADLKIKFWSAKCLPSAWTAIFEWVCGGSVQLLSAAQFGFLAAPLGSDGEQTVNFYLSGASLEVVRKISALQTEKFGSEKTYCCHLAAIVTWWKVELSSLVELLSTTFCVARFMRRPSLMYLGERKERSGWLQAICSWNSSNSISAVS